MNRYAVGVLALAGACVPAEPSDPLNTALAVVGWVIVASMLLSIVLRVRTVRIRVPAACLRCGTVDDPSTHTKGSILIEIVLWVCLIVPGLVYSLWRVTSGRVKVCRTCGSDEIVPADSPAGRRIAEA